MYCPNPECPDMIDTGTPGEYADHLVQCPLCGATLVCQRPLADAAEPRPRLLDTPRELATVGVLEDGAEAEIVRSILRGAGIPFVLEPCSDRELGGLAALMSARLPGVGALQIRVRAEDEEEARQLLEPEST